MLSRVLFAAAIAAPALASAATTYFRAIPDLPLPPGFAESSAATAFDGTEGRLVMVEAVGSTSADRVRAFYVESLPALGWSFSPAGESELLFLRGRERLSLTTSGDASRLRLQVQLTIRPASMNTN